MPSPFPGMDPYLEKPVRWQGFHGKLLNHIEEIFVACAFRFEPHEVHTQKEGA